MGEVGGFILFMIGTWDGEYRSTSGGYSLVQLGNTHTRLTSNDDSSLQPPWCVR
jgi:hypothetical protein